MMKKKVIIPVILIIVLGIGYFLSVEQDRWCPSEIEDKEIRGEVIRTCLYETRDSSGRLRIKSWEAKDKRYIYQEFYKNNVSQYSITYWSEGNKRCKEIKRTNNRFVPEGVDCTEIQSD